MTPLDNHICKSCGNTFTGMYCNQCGEKVIKPNERSFNAIVTHLRNIFSIDDNKFLSTLLWIVKRPGFISREYADGRRVLYFRPLQLFFILNLFYFLFPTLQLFSASLKTQMYFLLHSPWVRTLVIDKVVADGMTLNGFTLLYNEKSIALAKSLIIIFVGLASFSLSLIFHKRDRYYNDHLTLAVELAVFNLFVNAILLSILFWLANALFKLGNSSFNDYLNEETLTMIFVMTNMYFIYRAGRIFYNQKGKRLIFKSAVAIVGLFIALEVYRLILFFVTYWSL